MRWPTIRSGRYDGQHVSVPYFWHQAMTTGRGYPVCQCREGDDDCQCAAHEIHYLVTILEEEVETWPELTPHYQVEMWQWSSGQVEALFR